MEAYEEDELHANLRAPALHPPPSAVIPRDIEGQPVPVLQLALQSQRMDREFALRAASRIRDRDYTLYR